MGEVLQLVYPAVSGALAAKKSYSADVFTTDIKCHRFDVMAESPQLAYQEVMFDVAANRLDNIKAVAVFDGLSADRRAKQLPSLICQYQMLDSALNQ